MKYIDADRLKAEIDRIEEEARKVRVSGTDKEAIGADSKVKICLKLKSIIDSLQQQAAKEEREREREYRESCASYWKCVNSIIDKKRALPTFKGQLLHDFKNELHTMKQIVDLTNNPEINEDLFDKLALVFATWGGYHFHPNNPPIEDSLQQEQPEADLEEEINIYLRTFSSSFENGIEYTKNIARYFYELGKLNNARKEENK